VPDLFRNPTLAELDELIAAKDATILAVNAIEADPEKAKPLVAWRTRAPAEVAAWLAEWDAMRARYNAARALRVHVAASLALPPEVIWGRVMQSIRQAWDPAGSLRQAAPESPGDLVDLVRRLNAQGVSPDFSQIPQPVAPDSELLLFNAADAFLRSIPNFGTVIALLGLLFVASRKW